MRVVQISSQWYIVKDDNTKAIGFSVVDGPYAEQHWAVSAGRLNEI